MQFGIEIDSGKIMLFDGVNMFGMIKEPCSWVITFDFAAEQDSRNFYVLRPGEEQRDDHRFVKIIHLWYYGDPKYLTIFYSILAQFREETRCGFNFGIPEKLCPVVKPSIVDTVIDDMDKYADVVSKMSPTEDNLNDVCNAIIDFSNRLKDVD
jgi:hypothetical protein